MSAQPRFVVTIGDVSIEVKNGWSQLAMLRVLIDDGDPLQQLKTHREELSVHEWAVSVRAWAAGAAYWFYRDEWGLSNGAAQAIKYVSPHDVLVETKAQLMNRPGIGRQRAQEIIDKRKPVPYPLPDDHPSRYILWFDDFFGIQGGD